MKLLLLVLLACGLPLVSRSQEDRPIKELSFPKADVRDVLTYYQRLTGKPVLVPRIDFQALVTIESTEPFSREEAVNLIRKTLLESYGIELRTSDWRETLVTWSLDPKYPRRSDAPMTKTERDAQPTTTIRVIRPARDKFVLEGVSFWILHQGRIGKSSPARCRIQELPPSRNRSRIESKN